jgi:hypothetical protein
MLCTIEAQEYHLCNLGTLTMRQGRSPGYTDRSSVRMDLHLPVTPEQRGQMYLPRSTQTKPRHVLRLAPVKKSHKIPLFEELFTFLNFSPNILYNCSVVLLCYLITWYLGFFSSSKAPVLFCSFTWARIHDQLFKLISTVGSLMSFSFCPRNSIPCIMATNSEESPTTAD